MLKSSTTVFKSNSTTLNRPHLYKQKIGFQFSLHITATLLPMQKLQNTERNTAIAHPYSEAYHLPHAHTLASGILNKFRQGICQLMPTNGMALGFTTLCEKFRCRSPAQASARNHSVFMKQAWARANGSTHAGVH